MYEALRAAVFFRQLPPLPHASPFMLLAPQVAADAFSSSAD